MTSSDKLRVWEALSDAFLDTETHYDWIARKVKDIDLADLEIIFFEEVAIYCAQNLFTTAPPVWQGFTTEELIAGIEPLLSNGNKNSFNRLKRRAYVLLLRYMFKSDWQKIAEEIKKLKSEESAE